MSIVERLEALLFVSDGPVEVSVLAMTLGVTEGQVEQGLEVLEARLDERGAIDLVKIAGGYQLCTKQEHAELVVNYLKPQRQKLSRSLMEVLAVVAYNQPITITEIEQVRGVQSEYSVRALLERRLVEEMGRKPAPGRPVLYGTSAQFLHQFKMNDLTQLPKLEDPQEDAFAIVRSTVSPDA